MENEIKVSKGLPAKILVRETAEDGEQFAGVFSEEFRKRFEDHRRELGASYQQLASALRINWSTIRKWECGVTRTCHSRHIVRVSDFLNRRYDSLLKFGRRRLPGYDAMVEAQPEELAACFRRTIPVMGVSKCFPGEAERFLHELHRVANAYAVKLLELASPKVFTVPADDSPPGGVD